jgi:hypothetical protein
MDEYRLASITLAEAGFCGGDPEKTALMPVDLAVDVLAFLQFRSKQAETLQELNKPKP